jgi:hypothetical protein
MVKITGAEWKQLFELLDTFFELPEADQSAFLARIDGDSPDVGERLRHLLRPGESFPAEDLASSLPSLSGVHVHESHRRFAEAAALTAGAQIGPYRLIREVGYGGMSAVWLAARTDRLMHRHIALKPSAPMGSPTSPWSTSKASHCSHFATSNALTSERGSSSSCRSSLRYSMRIRSSSFIAI